MAIWEWVSQNWFNLFSSIGIIGSLWVAVFSLRSGTKTQKVGNLLTITGSHREIWKEFLNNPKLERVCDALADTVKQPVNGAEEVFVNMVIHHVNSVYYAMSDQLVINYEELRRDISEFVSLPIPKTVWEKTKQFQNEDFVNFVESCRNGK